MSRPSFLRRPRFPSASFFRHSLLQLRIPPAPNFHALPSAQSAPPFSPLPAENLAQPSRLAPTSRAIHAAPLVLPNPRPPKKGSRKDRGSFHFWILSPCLSIPISGFDTAPLPSPTLFLLRFFHFSKLLLLLFFGLQQQLFGRVWAFNAAGTPCLQNPLSVQLTLASPRQRAHSGGRLAPPKIQNTGVPVVRQYVSNSGTCTHEAGTWGSYCWGVPGELPPYWNGRPGSSYSPASARGRSKWAN